MVPLRSALAAGLFSIYWCLPQCLQAGDPVPPASTMLSMPQPMPSGHAPAYPGPVGSPGQVQPSMPPVACEQPPLPPCDTMVPPPPCPPKKSKRVVVELSQPNVHIVPARGTCAAPSCPQPAPQGGCAAPSVHNKRFSMFNLSINKSRGEVVGSAGVPQTFTQVVPAFATATVPVQVGIQTTRVATLGAGGVARSEFGLVSRESAVGLIRETIRQELAQQRRETDTLPESAPVSTQDTCAELKSRVDALETRIVAIEKKVEKITTLLDRLTTPQ